MIPPEDFLFGQTRAFHGGAEEVLQEVSLLFGGVDAGLPCLRRHRLVLDGDSPDRNPFPLVSLDEFRVVVGPRLIELRLELSTVQHVVVGLHECRWTPRAAEESELSAGSRQRPLDKRNTESLIMVDAERLQLLVTFVDVGVAGGREIAAVDVGSSQRVADSFVAIEVGVQNFPLFGSGDFGERFSGCVGECAADPKDRLLSFRRIDEDTDLGLERLTHSLERERVGRGEAVGGFVGSRVDGDRSTLDGAIKIGWRGRISCVIVYGQRRSILTHHQRRGRRNQETAAVDFHGEILSRPRQLVNE